ncbi:MAG: FGGY family carbohydrate kinase, partial [Solirubrobacteraceae bacterium]
MAADAVFLAIDVGTTGARAAAVDLDGYVCHAARHPYPTVTPRPGWAEQDPRQWLDAALAALADLTAADAVDPSGVQAIGLTGQCPTIAPFGVDGEPLGPGLLYRDNRATAEAEEMRELIGDEALLRRTGHVPTAFHVGPKLMWLRRHEPDTFAAAVRFLQPRDLVAHALTGTAATDETHANSTVLFDLRERAWSAELLGAFDLDGYVCHEARHPYPTLTPRPGWAEQDPRQWLVAALAALADLTAAEAVDPNGVQAIGLTGQCPTVAPFGVDGEPLGPGLLYRDNRATAEAEEMRELIGDEALHRRTGHVPTAF